MGSLKSHVSESLWLITFMEMERYPYRMKRFTALPSRSWPWHPWLVSKKLMPIIIDAATDGAVLVVHLSLPLPMALGSRSYCCPGGATLPSTSGRPSPRPGCQWPRTGWFFRVKPLSVVLFRGLQQVLVVTTSLSAEDENSLAKHN